MKKEIHPQYYKNAKVSCACGNTWETGSTEKEIRVEICSACHPFYTGKQKLVDTARRVEKFTERMSKKAAAAKVRRGRKVKQATRAARRKSISEKSEKLEIKKPQVIRRGKLETRNANKTIGDKVDKVNKVNKVVNKVDSKSANKETEETKDVAKENKKANLQLRSGQEKRENKVGK